MRWILLAYTLPAAVFSWLVGGLAIVLGVAHKPRWEPLAKLSLVWRPWVEVKMGVTRYSFTLLRTVFYIEGARDESPEATTKTERHEGRHIVQVEDNMFIAGNAALTMLGFGHDPWSCFMVWCLGAIMQLPKYVTGGMRYGWKNWYLDAEHERSAYAQTDMLGQLGRSFDELREDWRRNHG